VQAGRAISLGDEMDSIGPDGRVTNSTGEVDREGDVVGALERQTKRAITLARTSLEETGTVSPAIWEMVDGSLDAQLCVRIGTAVDPGHYIERPGLNARITEAGADPACVRRMLRLPS
jgi:hypothetical protein